MWEDETQGRLIGALLNQASRQNETSPASLREGESGHEEAFLWIPAFAGMTSRGYRYDN